jgi:putative lipoprotein
LRRGHLVLGHEVRSFEPCGGDHALWVVDETGGDLHSVYEDLSHEVYQRLYVEILGAEGERPEEGFGADYGGSITVIALRHAASESLGCNWDLSGILLRASGNEPFWHIDVRADEILLNEMDSGERVFLPPSATDESLQSYGGDGLAQFRGTAKVGPEVARGGSIVVTVFEQPCRDSMSGAFFSFAARIQVDGRELSGCARPGW